MTPPPASEVPASADHDPRACVVRIAICTVGQLFGGVERHVLGLLRGMHSRGAVPSLLLFHDHELAARARDEGVDPIILPRRNLQLFQTARHIANLLEHRGIGVVHVHGYKAMFFCSVARRWHQFAIVRTEHGLPELMTGGPVGTARAWLYHLLDGAAVQMTRPTVCYVTRDLQLHHRRTHARFSTATIPNGIPLMDRRLLPRPPEFQEAWFNVVAVGRLDTVKGLQIAVRALAAEGMSSDVHLHLVGTGPCESELRALAEKHGVAHRVHFLGFRRNAYDFIAHCDTLLMPSLHEGLPYTLLEAMALATPVIASRVGGLAEVLADQETALLVPAGDVEALARAILRLQGTPELRRRLGTQGQKLQQAKYSLEVMTDSYVAIYRALQAEVTSSQRCGYRPNDLAR